MFVSQLKWALLHKHFLRLFCLLISVSGGGRKAKTHRLIDRTTVVCVWGGAGDEGRME